jgi:hypothetical protein
MADPVKISELPAISSVQANDIIPIVDAALTQTSKATAAQIAAIGGGPPGDGTVTEGKIASGAVTYPKIQNVTGDRVLGRSSGSSGTVQEITCTSFARTLLAAADGNAARGLINDTPTFTGTVTANGNVVVTGTVTAAGQVLTGDGTAAAPSHSFSGDTNTGIARLGGGDSLSLVTGGVERLRVTNNGDLLSPITGGTTLLPHFGCRAFAHFHFFGGGLDASKWGNVSSISRFNVGHYGVNFITPMPDEMYVVAGSCNANIWSGAGYDDQWIMSPKQLYAATATLMTGDNNNEGRWDTYCLVAIFR